MKYCPNCGAEYLPGPDECADCQVALVDDPPELVAKPKLQPTLREQRVVFRSGRRMDAELVRARLEADGLEARIWSSGLGPWRMESAVTEITGVPSDFNSHQVVVDLKDEEWAREVLGEVVSPAEDEPTSRAIPEADSSSSVLALLRQRWMLLAFAFFLLLLVLLSVGPGGS
ncbi:MAG: hypothetical protein M3N53_06365 [Actinomycetota bacterium]|nr:hypothetical protein [Actinomycetota bacterium]